MKILAVDTATKNCSVAVVDQRDVLAEEFVSGGRTHSKHLMQTIQTALNMSGLTLVELDGFAVTVGPGSFTGLRIGISTIKGLAVATSKPIAGVSHLEALATQVCGSDGLICPLMDARKGEVYSARYRFRQGLLKRVSKERVAPPRKVLGDIQEPCLFVGDGVIHYLELISDMLGPLATVGNRSQHVVRASTIAFLGIRRFENSGGDDIFRLIPQYLRESDAVRNQNKRASS